MEGRGRRKETVGFNSPLVSIRELTYCFSNNNFPDDVYIIVLNDVINFIYIYFALEFSCYGKNNLSPLRQSSLPFGFPNLVDFIESEHAGNN